MAVYRVKAPARSKVTRRKPTERQDQVRLVMYLRTFYPQVLVAAVPNGAAVSGPQRVKLVSEGLLPGFPDLCVLEPRGPFHGLFVEMKSTAKTAVVSRQQYQVHKTLRTKGYKVLICYGYDRALASILGYLALTDFDVGLPEQDMKV